MAEYGSLPFAEQIDFLKAKLDVPTERWDDLLGAAHDRAFVVAGATGADLLADLHKAVLKGVEEGTTLAEFRRDFDQIVKARGWTGWTGSDTPEGVAWRTRIIYETNLRSSYAAGRWQQIQAGKAARPYLEYRHSDSVLSPRPLHLSWDGLVLAVDDPWWQTHYPPNGWGCKCRVFALGEDDLAKLGKSGPDQAPDDGTYEWTNRNTGEVTRVPAGIDPGWDYAPGASLDAGWVERKAATLPPPIADDFQAAMAAGPRRPPYVPAQRYADAETWALDHFAGAVERSAGRGHAIWGARMSDADALRHLNTINAEVDRMQQRYPKLRARVGKLYVTRSERGRAHSSLPADQASITLAQEWDDAVYASQDRWAATHGRPWDWIKNESHTAYNLRHELAHVLDGEHGVATKDPRWATLWKQYRAQKGADAAGDAVNWWHQHVTDYAATNLQEAFAECFAIYTSPHYAALPERHLPRDITDLIDAILEDRF